MIDDKKLKSAQNVYNSLCAMLDKKHFHYDKHPENLTINITINGDDIPMPLVISVDAKRDLVRLLSRIPVVFEGDKRIEGAIATSMINYRLVDGSFDYDYENGKVFFRLTSCYADSLISEELLEYMLGVSSHTIDDFNDKLLMLAKGSLPLEAFFKQ